jgi:chromatin remodeling complex protein RSC6
MEVDKKEDDQGDLLLAEIDAMSKSMDLFAKKAVKDLRGVFNRCKIHFRTINKRHAEELRNAKKTKKNRVGPSVQSGITKPRPITKALAEFLNVPTDTELSLVNVSGRVSAYIREHNLQNPAMRREINCDDKLSELLKPDELPVTYPKLQRYLNRHLIKPEKA